MVDKPKKSYLLIVKFGQTNAPDKTLGDFAVLSSTKDKFEVLLRNISALTASWAFRSRLGETVGYILVSILDAELIKVMLEEPNSWPAFRKNPNIAKSYLLNGEDSILIVEIGKDYAGSKNFPEALTMLAIR